MASSSSHRSLALAGTASLLAAGLLWRWLRKEPVYENIVHGGQHWRMDGLAFGGFEMQPSSRQLLVALEQYTYWKPESVIIEAKASGLPLTYELRQMDIPVVNFTPSKGNDKHARVNAVAPLFESGMIWAPEQKFAEEVIEECAAFPYGDHDDLVDSTTQAIMRFRQGGLIGHPEDYVDEKAEKPKRNYY